MKGKVKWKGVKRSKHTERGQERISRSKEICLKINAKKQRKEKRKYMLNKKRDKEMLNKKIEEN